jgi:hypothetical protein
VPRCTVYLPAPLYAEVKQYGISITDTCQRALALEVALAQSPEEGLEVMPDLYAWLRRGRRLLNQLEDLLT